MFYEIFFLRDVASFFIEFWFTYNSSFSNSVFMLVRHVIHFLISELFSLLICSTSRSALVPRAKDRAPYSVYIYTIVGDDQEFTNGCRSE